MRIGSDRFSVWRKRTCGQTEGWSAGHVGRINAFFRPACGDLSQFLQFLVDSCRLIFFYFLFFDSWLIFFLQCLLDFWNLAPIFSILGSISAVWAYLCSLGLIFPALDLFQQSGSIFAVSGCSFG